MDFTLFGSTTETILFGVFIAIITIFLIIDLGVFNRQSHRISTKSAAYQTLFWIAISLSFGWVIYEFDGGTQPALEYFSAYLLEKALSFDNIFVMIVIFNYFKIDEKHYHRILFWGILGAVIFRAIFIFLGIMLVSQFEFILYIFGAFLVYTGVKMFFDNGEADIEPEKNPVVKFARRFLIITTDTESGRFAFRKAGKLVFTTLFLVLILIETTDLVFALDSIPAALAVSQNQFVVYTSNIFAVLGLRAMFFLLAGIMNKFRHLQKGLSFILIFIGAKMLLEKVLHHYFELEIPDYVSFVVIVGSIGLSILYSYLVPAPEEDEVVNEDSPSAQS